MIGLRSFRRFFLAAIAAATLCASLAPARADVDPAAMSGDAIRTLEQRLTEAGCYTGAIDGQASDALMAAIKACPDQRPVLRIETGMHTAPIVRIGVDAACSRLATASDDKTVRLWSLPDGKLERVIHLPIGNGNVGKVDATALSPDGRWLAAGGWSTGSDQKESLTVVDLSKSAIRRFGAFENVIKHVAFSADGRRVAVGLGGNNGVRVLDAATGAELLADRDYGDGVYGLAFAPDGGLIASSDDGQLRRYGPDLTLTAKRKAPGGKDPYGVAIDPAGRRVAVGYYDETPVSILDARTLAPLAEAQTGDLTSGDLSSVAWSHDGATLAAGGKAYESLNGARPNLLRQFDASGRRKGEDVAASDSTIMDVQTCGDGFAFAAADPAFGLLSAQGEARTLQGPRTADMRAKLGTAFALAPDAASVRFGLGYREEEPVLFDLAAASLTDAPSLPPRFQTANVGGLPVSDWEDKYAPKLKGAKLALDAYERSRALAIRPDASGFALGTDWLVRAYDAQGTERWKRAGPGAAWGVDFSADGDILTVAYRDGTIRWLRWSDGVELLALFVAPQSRKWVAWTPTGYYMASAGGEDLIGWHVNRGWTQEADFFPASQFRAEYNRPDIVRLVLKTRDEAAAIRQANATAQREVAKPVAAALPPVVTITSPGAYFSGGTIDVTYALRSPSGLPVDRLDVLADGQKVSATGFEATKAPNARGHLVVTVPRRNEDLTLVAHSGDLPSAPVKISLIYDGPPAPSPAAPGQKRLYMVLAGVTGYTAQGYDTIHLAADDAKSIAAAFKAQEGGALFGHVESRIIDAPTRQAVFEGLYWLQEKMTEDDIAVIFLSGHGFLDRNQRFWFLTREADPPGRLPTTAIPNDQLLDVIGSIRGKKVVFIDACHAGQVLAPGAKGDPSETTPDMNKVVNDFAAAGPGLVVFGASTGRESALEPRTPEEDRRWKHHSAYAEALIEAIGEGKASGDDREITTSLLDHYLLVRVEELTGNRQHPVMSRPPGQVLPDFPVAAARP